MTQIAFLRKAELPTNKQIQEHIQKLGYDFQISSDPEKKLDDEASKCTINGHKSYFETYFFQTNDLTSEMEVEWIIPDLTDQDIAITFVWGADFSAGACIGLISIALIDLSDALIYYIDDQTKYTREMLIEDTPYYLEELNKQVNLKPQESVKYDQIRNNIKQVSFWMRLKNIFK